MTTNDTADFQSGGLALMVVPVGGLGAFYLYPEPVVSICPQLKDLWSFLSMYDVILISAGFKFKQVLWGFYMHSGKCRQYFGKLQS